MICATCGATSTTGDTVCAVCGTPLPAEVAEPAAAWGGPPPSPNASPANGDSGAAAVGWEPQPAHPSGLSSEVRSWGMAAHLVGLGGAFLTAVTLGFVGPLVIWLAKRDEHAFIDHHAKESLNFQLTTLVVAVAALIAAIPVVILGALTLGVLWIVAAILALVAFVAWFVFPIVGAVKAANGESYRYPVNIRFIR